MSSTTAKFTFPETLDGQHKISSSKSSGSKQTQSTERCIYVVQEYNCSHHPSLNTPHIFHRTPCPQALLPIASQTDCENYPHHEDELVQVSRYVMDRGCMECKTLARARRHEEAAKHPEILRRMQEMGLGQEDIDHFEKVTSSFPASRRVLQLVRAREKNERLRREEEREELRRKEGEDEARKQIGAKQKSGIRSNENDSKFIIPATLASSVQGPIVEQNDSAEKERETKQIQNMAQKVKNTQCAKIPSEKNPPHPCVQSTELKHPTPGTAPEKKFQRDELSQPQAEGPSPTDENIFQSSAKSTELRRRRPIVTREVVQRDEPSHPQPSDPSPTDKETSPQASTNSASPTISRPSIPAEKNLPTTQTPKFHLEAPINEANFTPSEPKSHEPQATPPNSRPSSSSPSAEEEPAAPEKLTDNIHLDLDEEWDTDEEIERVFGEVALAPSFGCQTGDEWIVVGSWEQ